MPDDEPPTSDQVDEQWFAEWCAYGFAELAYYLLKQARFAQWLAEHSREDPSCNPPQTSQT